MNNNVTTVWQERNYNDYSCYQCLDNLYFYILMLDSPPAATSSCQKYEQIQFLLETVTQIIVFKWSEKTDLPWTVTLR